MRWSPGDLKCHMDNKLSAKGHKRLKKEGRDSSRDLTLNGIEGNLYVLGKSSKRGRGRGSCSQVWKILHWGGKEWGGLFPLRGITS